MFKKKKSQLVDRYVLVQVISFLTLGKLELMEFCWLGVAEQGQLIKTMWIKLVHLKVSG